MLLPSKLLAVAKTRRFWTDFFWITDTSDKGYSQLAKCKVELRFPDGSRLSLSLDEMLCYFSLELAAPGCEPVEIAWDDQAHWHPHLLRWQELEAICQSMVLQDSKLPHPGILLLFLCRFAPICVGDDIDLIVPRLEEAWRGLGLFSDSEIREFIERLDARDAAFVWRHGPNGSWYLTQEKEIHGSGKGLYTTRGPNSTEFPFRQWEGMIDSIGKAMNAPWPPVQVV